MTDSKTHRVFLVDDHPLVREWLTNLIHQQPDLSVCGEAEDFADAMREIPKSNPDIVIVDISLRSGSGLELIKAIKLRNPGISLLVLSMHDEAAYAERAIRAGARGYVMKRETAKKIIEGIRQVLEGRLFLSDRVAEHFANKFAHGGSMTGGSPVETLSDRELEVFDLLGQGVETRRIAEILRVNIKTVQAYCARIKEKLALANAAELLREAVRWHDQQTKS